MALTDAKWNGIDPVDVFVALVGLLERPAWQKDASCREHPELSWFPGKRETRTAQAAICATCLVRAECADAGANEVEGIWGGVAARRLRRERRTAA